MSTPSTAQIEANHANSKLSTGPIAQEGKAAPARNATQHGLTATRVSFHISGLA